MDASILTTLIATGSAIGGALIKMAYDTAIERIRKNQENQERFIEERKQVYDDFLGCNKEYVKYRRRIQEIVLIVRAGKQLKPGVIESIPDSSLPDLIDVLEKMRRIARTHEMVKIAERIVRLHGDTAAAQRYYLQEEGLSYGLPLFLAERLGEDQTLEFIAAYRRDLHIGPPVGARRDYPVVERPVPLHQAEHVLRSHLRTSPQAATNDASFVAPKPLTQKDIHLLNSPRFQELVMETPPPEEKAMQ